MDSPKKDFSVLLSTNDGHIAVENLQKLQKALASISGLVDADEPVDCLALRSILTDGEDGAQQLSELFRARMDPIFYNERRATDSTAAIKRTFNTPELLEMVLLHVDIPSLFSAMSVSRQFFDAIDTTQSLRQKMALQPIGTGFFSTILRKSSVNHVYEEESCGLKYAVQIPWPEICAEAPVVDMDFFIYFDCRDLPAIGARWRDILVCDPKVTVMSVYPACFGSWVTAEYHIKKGSHYFSSDTGITVGDLLDQIEPILQSHRNCQTIGWGQCSLVGPSRITFHSTIKVRSDDPAAAPYLDWCVEPGSEPKMT